MKSFISFIVPSNENWLNFAAHLGKGKLVVAVIAVPAYSRCWTLDDLEFHAGKYEKLMSLAGHPTHPNLEHVNEFLAYSSQAPVGDSPALTDAYWSCRSRLLPYFAREAQYS